jgi:hypothetical protein
MAPQQAKTAETFREFAATAISHHWALNDQLIVRRLFLCAAGLSLSLAFE